MVTLIISIIINTIIFIIIITYIIIFLIVLINIIVLIIIFIAFNSFTMIMIIIINIIIVLVNLIIIIINHPRIENTFVIGGCIIINISFVNDTWKVENISNWYILYGVFVLVKGRCITYLIWSIWIIVALICACICMSLFYGDINIYWQTYATADSQTNTATSKHTNIQTHRHKHPYIIWKTDTQIKL